MLAAQVAVNNATFHFDKLYSYKVPETLANLIAVGSMVLVPFGRGTAKARMGVVLQLETLKEENDKLKCIFDVAPEKARLSPELLDLVYFLKERTFCTYYEAVKAIIPYGAQYKAVNEGGVPHLQKQLVRHTYRSYRVCQPLNMAMKYSPKQKAVLAYLGDGAAGEQAILDSCGITKAVLDTMCKKNILSMTQEDMIPELSAEAEPAAPILLNRQQQIVFEELLGYMQKKQAHAALLHGVTSSGKTLVFIKLMQQALALHKTALVLVPEISLTPQMIRRLRSVFGSRVAVQHSALNNTQRLLQWQQIQNGEADIVVGTRSAVFAPLQNIGIIIIDEEQEHTYASEQSPRFLAHDVAKKRAVTYNALLLLASATPSVESYYNAQQGRYSLHTLPERYGARPLPEVEMIDMRQ
ncbi:MAG: DEAD/DEAH box helicase, partial [Oscillospiraceae bacterium]|nr:DEAD/DEAH box helicase [Oscillospiraceae bacterium]